MQKLLTRYGIKTDGAQLFTNAQNQELVNVAVKNGEGQLTKAGALTVLSGKQTGRAAKDKYIVKSKYTESIINWESDINPMSNDQFNKIQNWAAQTLSQSKNLYVAKRSTGTEAQYNMQVNLITPSATHNLFFNHMFLDLIPNGGKLEEWSIIHVPHRQLDAQEFGTKNGICIALNYETQTVIIIGTAYAGEIKKSIFSIMNTLLPDLGVLPMHAGASVSDKGTVSVFFGLSGTGKTTLSTDVGSKIIGDDEHGLTSKGVFNFENGCYAKTYKLSKDGEPEIYKAIHTPLALVENVKVVNGEIDFNDMSITENGRASYPLSFIDEVVESGKGGLPQHIFFLSADAFGVLPPVSKLTEAQAMYFFLSGYTAKLAGTEVGVQEPQAAFSSCFGAPFMMRHANDYAELLGKYLKENKIHVWLVNTGWSGGVYGVGSRFPLKVTRQIIRSIQSGELNKTEILEESIFGLKIPTHIPGIPSELLLPKRTWENALEYETTAHKLAEMFHKNFKKFKKINPKILEGAPLYGRENTKTLRGEA
ncbi:MAG: phosphoenolpyruvate carboxykinase (ATP) [Bacteriovoracaceae bacterium]|nr:phosphoenolpyruvate carboxykinase (ATP) [Bacteriovoracaceae bacterium]